MFAGPTTSSLSAFVPQFLFQSFETARSAPRPATSVEAVIVRAASRRIPYGGRIGTPAAAEPVRQGFSVSVPTKTSGRAMSVWRSPPSNDGAEQAAGRIDRGRTVASEQQRRQKRNV